MRHKLLLLLVPAVCVLLLTTSLYLNRDYLVRLPLINVPFQQEELLSTSASPSSSFTQAAEPSTSPSSPLSTTSPQAITVQNGLKPISNIKTSRSYLPTRGIGTVLSEDSISLYVTAILDTAVTEPTRLKCPSLDRNRYNPLVNVQNSEKSLSNAQHIDYYFALDLSNCLTILPRLIGSIVEAIRFLGPSRCALSIVEGNSPDGTADVLLALRPYFERLGFSYFYRPSDINPSEGERIRKLAELRNLALQPLFDDPERASENTTVLFINDVAACTEDLLELALQRRILGADMTCAMDWTYVGTNPTFYDVWIGRTIGGDSFFEIPADGSWDSAWNLFWNAPDTKARYRAHLPFQVFSCWNGAAAFSAAPLLDGLRFRDIRGGTDGECRQGEPQLFCKDMWLRGQGKIAVIPAVNLEYSDEKATDLKQRKGYTSDLVRNQAEDSNSSMIDWVLEPPERVKCMPTWSNQFWRPWNESVYR